MKKLLKLSLGLTFLILVIIAVAAFCLFYRTANWSLADSPSTELLFPDKDRDLVFSDRIRHVVLISIDTCRADHLGCYHYSRKTSPNIDAVAAEGVLFNHAVSPVPLTFPSHCSMLTGTIPPYHKVRDNNNYTLNSANLTLAEILKNNGFKTGAVVGAVVLDSRFGLNQGFDMYNDHIEGRENASQFAVNERNAAEVTRLGIDWLEENRREKTFLFLHYYDPHTPYVQHNRLVLPFSKCIYDDEITYTDSHIGKIVETLNELKIYDSTLLIITGDHGEGLGEHSEKTHGFFIYQSTQHVPLIVRVPGGPVGIVHDTVGLIDIVPTVCNLLGIPLFTTIQGKDLSAYFLKEASRPNQEPRFLYCESLTPTQLNAGPFLGLVSGRWKYIHTSEPELYDLLEDPKETKDLSEGQKLHVGIMQHELRAIIEDKLFHTVSVKKNVLDEKTRRRLQSLGYVSGGPVDENIQFEQKTVSPRDLIEIYNLWEKVLVCMGNGKYEKAKKLCHEMLRKRPDIKQPYFHLGQMAIFEKDSQDVLDYFSALLEDEGQDLNLSEMPNKKNQYAQAHTNIGAVLAEKGKFEQALEHHKKALFYNPESIIANFNVGGVYLGQNNLAEAAVYFTKVLELDPEMAEANRYLGNIRLKQGRYDEAIVHFTAILNAAPASGEAQAGLNEAKKQLSKDIVLQEQSLEKNPDQPDLHTNLGILFWEQGNFEKALYHWEKGIGLNPEQPNILNNVAWLKAVFTKERFYDPDEAVNLARKACEITDYQETTFIDTLSICYAAKGEFEKAIATAEKALDLAENKNQQQVVKEIQEHLLLFKAGKSYRQEK